MPYGSAVVFHKSLTINTDGRGTYDVTQDVQKAVHESEVTSGLCTIFLHHTSASIVICENADPSVRRDLETFFARLIADGDPMFSHDAEGPDDMPSHLRTILTQSSLSLPVVAGRCDLGTWQGIYLWEHRRAGHRRRVTVSVVG